MRDIKPLLILLLSIGLVGTWVYHLYDKTQYTQRRTEVYVKDSAAIADAIRDSLGSIYKATITELDSKLDVTDDSLVTTRTVADSLQKRLQSKIQEINRLKAEISAILGKGKVTPEEMVTARGKIGELQQRVSELENQNMGMEAEKKELLTKFDNLVQHSGKLEQNIRRLNEENSSLSEKINQAAYFVASEVRLTAVNMRSSNEEETNQVKKADKFVASFVLQNNVNQYNNAEVVIVLIQPDRQVLQSSNWDSGVFETKAEGRKSFTRIIKFDYAKSERKQLTFSLDTEEFQKGNYILQVWHNGKAIGQAVTTLN